MNFHSLKRGEGLKRGKLDSPPPVKLKTINRLELSICRLVKVSAKPPPLRDVIYGWPLDIPLIRKWGSKKANKIVQYTSSIS